MASGPGVNYLHCRTTKTKVRRLHFTDTALKTIPVVYVKSYLSNSSWFKIRLFPGVGDDFFIEDFFLEFSGKVGISTWFTIGIWSVCSSLRLKRPLEVPGVSFLVDSRLDWYLACAAFAEKRKIVHFQNVHSSKFNRVRVKQKKSTHRFCFIQYDPDYSTVNYSTNPYYSTMSWMTNLLCIK